MEKHLTIMNKKENFYLIKIEKYKDFLLNKKIIKKKFSALKKKIIIFFDHHITLFEILRIYFFFTKVFFCTIKFLFKKEVFNIKNNNCFNILYPLFYFLLAPQFKDP